MLDISQVQSEAQIIAVQELLREYTAWAFTLASDSDRAPTFQGLEDELKTLPGVYAPPAGRLLLATQDGQPAGCVGLKGHDATTCELKRFYVRPGFRGRKIGWQLVNRLVKEARQSGYQRIVLDSHKSMEKAHALYRAVGFTRVSAPDDFPETLKPVVVFMECDISINHFYKERAMHNMLDPSHIMETATAFWPSKVLLTAVELDLFSVLGERAMTASELMETLELHPRGTYDFFDALVALKFLERDGDGPDGWYKNTPETAAFLDKKSSTYIGGMPRMLNARLFGFWDHLGTALKTGKPQSEIKVNGRSFFEGLYTDEARLREFMTAMNGFQAGNFHAVAEKFDFSKYQTVSDIGGALALFSRIVGAHHPHLTFTSFDLPPVAPLAQEQIDAAGMSERIAVVSGDFFVDDLPKADVVSMGNILHDWNLEKKKILIQKAYAALPDGGAYIVIENVIDDARRENAFGLLMSLNMLIELGDGFDYTGADFRQWCSEVGFKRFEFIPLTGPASAAVAYK